MILHTNDCAFKSAFLLLSALLLPANLICLILTIKDFRIELMLVTLFFLIVYSTLILTVYRLSNNEKYFVDITGDIVTVKHPYHQQNLKLDRNDVTCISYYKLSSIKSWLLLHNFVTPQAVYLTYKINEVEKSIHIGYCNYENLYSFCDAANIELIKK